MVIQTKQQPASYSSCTAGDRVTLSFCSAAGPKGVCELGVTKTCRLLLRVCVTESPVVSHKLTGLQLLRLVVIKKKMNSHNSTEFTVYQSVR